VRNFVGETEWLKKVTTGTLALCAIKVGKIDPSSLSLFTLLNPSTQQHTKAFRAFNALLFFEREDQFDQKKRNRIL
jgi:hypothetical protein